MEKTAKRKKKNLGKGVKDVKNPHESSRGERKWDNTSKTGKELPTNKKKRKIPKVKWVDKKE